MLRVAGVGVITQCGIKRSTSAGTHGTILYSLFHLLWQIAFLGGRTLIVTKLSCLVTVSPVSPHSETFSILLPIILKQVCYASLDPAFKPFKDWFSVGHTRLFRTKPNLKNVYDQTHGLTLHCQATPIYLPFPENSKQTRTPSLPFLKERVQVLYIRL